MHQNRITFIIRKSTNPLPISFSNFTNALNFSSSLQTIPNSSTNLVVQNPLYNLLPHTHNPNNIVNLICSNLKQNNGNLTSLHKDIQWVLPHLGTDEISRVLLRCQSDPFQAFNFFNWVKHDLGLKPTTNNYCIIVHVLAWSHKFTLAMRFLSEMIDITSSNGCGSEDVYRNLVSCTDGCNWSPVVFDMLIKIYVKKGKVQEGFQSFRNTINIGLTPSVSACNCLLNGLLKSNYINLCWGVYSEMERRGISPNTYTFNILTHVLCKEGDVRKVNGFIEKMEEEGFDPDVVTYNTLIESYSKKGRLDDAFYLYKIMYRRFVPPDLVTYTALMKGLCNKGKVKEAHQLFHRMMDRGFDPDVTAFNSLICGYSKEGKMQEAKSLLNDLMQRGLSPNSCTCRLLVEGYAKRGKLQSSLNLVTEFQRFGVSIPREVYNFVGVSLCETNKPHAAKSLMNRMFIDGHEPTPDIYNQLIQCFCKSDDLNAAVLLRGEMFEKGLKPDISTYRVLIYCLGRLSRTAEGEIMMKEMVEAGLVPDSDICKSLVIGYCKEKDFDKAESILRYFAMELQIYDSESYNALIEACCEDGGVLKSLELQDKMLKLGFVPTRLTCKSVVNGILRATNDGKKIQVYVAVLSLNPKLCQGHPRGDHIIEETATTIKERPSCDAEPRPSMGRYDFTLEVKCQVNGASREM